MAKRSIDVLKEYVNSNLNKNKTEFIEGLIDVLAENNTPITKAKAFKNNKPVTVYLTENGNLLEIAKDNSINITKAKDIEKSPYEIISSEDNSIDNRLNKALDNAQKKLSDLFSKYSFEVPISFNIDSMVEGIKYLEEQDNNIIHVYEHLYNKLLALGYTPEDIKTEIYDSVKIEFAKMIWFQVVLKNNFFQLERKYKDQYEEYSVPQFSEDLINMVEKDFWMSEIDDLLNVLGEKKDLLSKSKNSKNSKKITNL